MLRTNLISLCLTVRAMHSVEDRNDRCRERDTARTTTATAELQLKDGRGKDEAPKAPNARGQVVRGTYAPAHGRAEQQR